ncbi:MAG: hypothetical protein QM784_37905 [Polyangiaceae bacterium]
MKRLHIPFLLTPLLPCLLALSGCTTNEADLGHTVTLSSSPPPKAASSATPIWKIVDHEPFLGGFAVAHDKLAWFSGKGVTERPQEAVEVVFRKHCDVNDCAGSAFSESKAVSQTTSSQLPFPYEVFTDGSRFYWTELEGDSNATPKLVSCDVEMPKPTTTTNDVFIPSLEMNGALFGCDANGRVQMCTASDCAATIEDITPTPPVNGDTSTSPCPQAASDGYLYAASTYEVFRYRADPDDRAVEHIDTGHTEDMLQIATNGKEVFWIEFVLGTQTGELKSCPSPIAPMDHECSCAISAAPTDSLRTSTTFTSSRCNVRAGMIPSTPSFYPAEIASFAYQFLARSSPLCSSKQSA